MTQNTEEVPPPETRVDEIFAKMDQNADGVLTIAEFAAGINCDPFFSKLLNDNVNPM